MTVEEKKKYEIKRTHTISTNNGGNKMNHEACAKRIILPAIADCNRRIALKQMAIKREVERTRPKHYIPSLASLPPGLRNEWDDEI